MSEGAEEGSKDRPGGRPGQGEEKVGKDRCQNWPKRREQGQMSELTEEGCKDRCQKGPKKGARTGRVEDLAEVKKRCARTDVRTGLREGARTDV